MIFISSEEALEKRINDIFKELLDQYEGFQISISMGVALWPRHALTYEALFHCADQALYASKRSGKNKYSFYDETMQNMLSILSPIESDPS